MADTSGAAEAAGRQLGPIVHIAYIVDDIHAAVQYWVNVCGYGPFVLVKNVRFKECTFKGVDSAPEITLAFAARGDLQIELIQAHNDAPSVFVRPSVDWRGIHHVGIRVADIESETARLVETGMAVVGTAVNASGTRLAFLDGGPSRGMVELIQSADGGAFAERVRRASEGWDGKLLYAS